MGKTESYKSDIFSFNAWTSFVFFCTGVSYTVAPCDTCKFTNNYNSSIQNVFPSHFIQISRYVSASLPFWLNMITFGVHQSSPFTDKNEENRRSGVLEYVCQCMVWANCTQFQKKEGLLGWVERALTALPFIAALSFIRTHKGCVGWGWRRGALFVFPATEKVPGESGCVSDLMSHPGSAPRAPSNSTAWESRADSALLSGPGRRLGYSVQARCLCQCLPLFLSFSSMFSVCI